jgi:hypothetical protein
MHTTNTTNNTTNTTTTNNTTTSNASNNNNNNNNNILLINQIENYCNELELITSDLPIFNNNFNKLNNDKNFKLLIHYNYEKINKCKLLLNEQIKFIFNQMKNNTNSNNNENENLIKEWIKLRDIPLQFEPKWKKYKFSNQQLMYHYTKQLSFLK